MHRIIYIGRKAFKADSVAKTGLTWARGEVHEVEDDEQAAKLLEHPTVWADADTDYKLAEIPAAQKPEPKPTVLIAPQGGENVSPYWEPVTIVVPAEVFKALQSKEFVAVFMKPEDADAYEAYKKQPEDLNWKNLYYEERAKNEAIEKQQGQAKESNIIQPWEMDKRSKAYKEWAATNQPVPVGTPPQVLPPMTTSALLQSN